MERDVEGIELSVVLDDFLDRNVLAGVDSASSSESSLSPFKLESSAASLALSPLSLLTLRGVKRVLCRREELVLLAELLDLLTSLALLPLLSPLALRRLSVWRFDTSLLVCCRFDGGDERSLSLRRWCCIVEECGFCFVKSSLQSGHLVEIDSAVSLCGLDVDGLSASFERDLERVLEVIDGAFVEPGGVSGGLNTSSSSAASDC